MELVIGLSSNKLAHIVTDQGAREIIPVAQLKTRGTPLGRFKAASVNTNFEGWRLLGIEEANTYPQAFGIQADMSNHQVFEFSSGSHLYRVPAIVLIRALLKSNASLTAAIFKPQGLELTITPVFKNDLLLNCVLLLEKSSFFNRDFLLWLYAYPSAVRMFHSIFRCALDDRIGVTLPIGSVEVRPSFAAKNRLHKIRHVTALCISSLRTEELPREFYECNSQVIKFYRGTVDSCSQLFDEEIPLASGDKAALSDKEWADIQPILSRLYLKHDPRKLLDGILNKLASAHPWRKCTYDAGTWSNASNFYQVLMRSGKWLSIMAILHRHRTASAM